MDKAGIAMAGKMTKFESGNKTGQSLQMRTRTIFALTAMAVVFAACSTRQPAVHSPVNMVIIDPGHFHAALPQKGMLEGVCDTVRVFAPEGPEVQSYLSTIASFNGREQDPTSWVEVPCICQDFLDSVPQAGKGDFVVLAGNNSKKSAYILEAVKKGYNVLSDKPMAIDEEGYAKVKEAYALAEEKGLLVYDLMTERYDVLNEIVRGIVASGEVFRSPLDSVSMESVHHFYKNVAGSVLTRPQWYYDVTQQGEGIADVTTHLVDLAFWQCFPGEGVKAEDVVLKSASHYPTTLTPAQFKASTGADSFPSFLSGCVKDGNLEVFSNGEFSFEAKGVPMTIAVRWDFEAPQGTGDTYSAKISGKEAVVEIIQDESTGYVEQLYVTASDEIVAKVKECLANNYPFANVIPSEEVPGRWLVDVREADRPGHEEHFNVVASTFIGYLGGARVPAWEKVNTLTKYLLTTSAVSRVRSGS